VTLGGKRETKEISLEDRGPSPLKIERKMGGSHVWLQTKSFLTKGEPNGKRKLSREKVKQERKLESIPEKGSLYIRRKFYIHVRTGTFQKAGKIVL